MRKAIIIITSGQPSANPRAVKEAILLSENNYQVTFIYCPISPWADEYDKKLILDYPKINWISVGYHSTQNKIGYKFARVRRKFWEVLNLAYKNNASVCLKSSVLFSQELLSESLKHKADLYIAHNIGAIRATIDAAFKHKAKVGFDAEDFHRGEFLTESKEMKRTALIEKKYFPLLNYCTVASPLIGNAFKKIFPEIYFQTINNVFPIKFLKNNAEKNISSTLNLFWFSQFIGPNRGIEDFIDALNKSANKNFKLNLMGNISDTYKSEIINLINDKTNINFIEPGPPSETFHYAQKFDIGIASETSINANRDYCLTNKIFTYLLSGNVILFSKTKGQEKFLNENKGIGFLYNSGNVNEINEILKMLYLDRELLNEVKQKSLALAKSNMNWEMESKRFLSIIENTLK